MNVSNLSDESDESSDDDSRQFTTEQSIEEDKDTRRGLLQSKKKGNKHSDTLVNITAKEDPNF